MAVEAVKENRFLLLKNYCSASESDRLMLESFSKHIKTSVPDARLDVCCIADGEHIPVLDDYRLVILSGGKVNLLNEDKPSWALRVLDMVRNLSNQQTGPKLLGICWGHQAVHYALGGMIAWVGDGPNIGVQNIQLTAAGQQAFGNESLNMHKYHVRYVSELADDFTVLARDNEISLSRSGRILTFQGHPELTYEITNTLRQGDDDGRYRARDPGTAAVNGDRLLQDISAPHDGTRIWTFILNWAMSK